MMPTIYKTNVATDFAEHAALAIETFLRERFVEKKVLNIALSGGSSPIPVYQALVDRGKVLWSRVNLFLVDERYVPLNSKESNFKMIQENLVEPAGNVRRFYHFNTREPISILVDQYQKLLQEQEAPIFDLVILGLGADGHTASLFPQDPALHESRRLVTRTQKPDPVSPQDRLTLTFPALLSSHKIIFLIQGKEKAPVVDRLLGGDAPLNELPASGVLKHTDIEIFYYA